LILHFVVLSSIPFSQMDETRGNWEKKGEHSSFEQLITGPFMVIPQTHAGLKKQKKREKEGGK